LAAESISFLMLADVIEQAHDLRHEVRALDLPTAEAAYFHTRLDAIERHACELVALFWDNTPSQ
jgi:hypothetical protein